MPNIFVKVPKGSFPSDARANLITHIVGAAATAEQIPLDPRMQALTWVVIEEVEPGMWTCGGRDLSEHVLTCFAQVHVPQGVLDQEAREIYVQLMHEAFKRALPQREKRQLTTSIILQDVVDGTWGGNGAIWSLPEFATAAGYKHLQHLAAESK